MNGKHLTAESLPTTDPSSGECACNAECRTCVVLDDFYQCQIHRSDCGYAVPFGITYLCLSARRQEFSYLRQQQDIRQNGSIL